MGKRIWRYNQITEYNNLKGDNKNDRDNFNAQYRVFFQRSRRNGIR